MVDDDVSLQRSSDEPAVPGASSHRLRRKLIGAGALLLIAALVASNVLLWTSLNSTKRDLRTAQADVTRLDSASGSAVQDLADRVAQSRPSWMTLDLGVRTFRRGSTASKAL